MSFPIKKTPQGCKLCLFEGIEGYEKDYADGHLTAEEVTSNLKQEGIVVGRQTWWNHMKYHVSPQVAAIVNRNAPTLASEMVDKVGELIGAIDKLKNKIDDIDIAIHAGTDPALIKAYTGLISEMRKNVETLANIQGELKGTQNVFVKNMSVEYTNVVGQVLQDACANCKIKFARTLEPLITKIDAKDNS